MNLPLGRRLVGALAGAALLASLLPAAAGAVVVGPVARLAFGVQPTSTAAGAPISPPVTVRIEDAGGNVATASSASVTLAIGTNPGGGTLSGRLTVAAVHGIATFSNLSINHPGSGYTLIATSRGLTAATSGTFPIGSGAKAALAIASDTAVGRTQTGFAASTKVVKGGAWVTIRFQTRPALAGKTLGIWLSRKINGRWTTFSPHTSVKTNAQGVAYYSYRAGSKVWESFVARYAGDATTAPSSSSGTQARWL
ncbi:MAG: hypothetical protein IVW53_10320 [Chloroflexi bacterium]|nr:hypothetical protein [Chloroflexota bacterium]